MNKSLLSCNPFELFDINPTFDIDYNKLISKYHILQKKYHPDSGHTSEISAYINNSFNILSSQLLRAQLLLKLLNQTYTDKDIELNNVFLIKQIELNNLITQNKNNLSQLTQLEKNILCDNDVIYKQISLAFDQHDYNMVYQLIIRLKFNQKQHQMISDYIYKLL